MAKNGPHKEGGGSSHQRTVAKTKKVEESTASPGVPEDRSSESRRGTLSRSSIEAYVFAAIGIILAVVPMTWWLRGIGLAVLIPIALDLIWHSPITHRAKSYLKVIIGLAAILIIGIIAAMVMPAEYRKEHSTLGLSSGPPSQSLRVRALALAAELSTIKEYDKEKYGPRIISIHDELADRCLEDREFSGLVLTPQPSVTASKIIDLASQLPSEDVYKTMGTTKLGEAALQEAAIAKQIGDQCSNEIQAAGRRSQEDLSYARNQCGDRFANVAQRLADIRAEIIKRDPSLKGGRGEEEFQYLCQSRQVKPYPGYDTIQHIAEYIQLLGQDILHRP